MALRSKYTDGVFSDGQWLCACNKRANWKTSNQPQSKGQKFLRCPNQGEEQCDFFLTAEDEPRARMEKCSEDPPAPRTPLQGQTSIKRFLPTPNTDRVFKSPRRNLFGKSPAVSPMPCPESGGNEGDLTSIILGILNNNGIALKTSTQLRIQSSIEDFQAGWEGRLAASNASLERVLRRIDEMEEIQVHAEN